MVADEEVEPLLVVAPLHAVVIRDRDRRRVLIVHAPILPQQRELVGAGRVASHQCEPPMLAEADAFDRPTILIARRLCLMPVGPVPPNRQRGRSARRGS
jgi:hypothetical protein